MKDVFLLSAEWGELLGSAAFSAEELARACGVAPGWVWARVEAGMLRADEAGGAWRFDSVTVVRARRIAQLESTFGADPELAALTTDLIEEVVRLRRLPSQAEAAERSVEDPGAKRPSPP